MKIAISNLAWDREEDNQVATLLRKYRTRGVEIAPTKVWPGLDSLDNKQIDDYRQFWLDQGVSIIAVTSLLYGHPELKVFGTEQDRQVTLNHLAKVASLANKLGAKVLVFGSPKNRQTNGLPKNEVQKIAERFFWQAGELAKLNNLFFGIEPLPSEYGTDFISNLREGFELVRTVNHPNFRLHLDLGAMTINDEVNQESLKKVLPVTCHVHISEPLIKPVPAGLTNHSVAAEILKSLKYNQWVSIEMPLESGQSHIETIEKTLKFVTKVYG